MRRQLLSRFLCRYSKDNVLLFFFGQFAVVDLHMYDCVNVMIRFLAAKESNLYLNCCFII